MSMAECSMLLSFKSKLVKAETFGKLQQAMRGTALKAVAERLSSARIARKKAINATRLANKLVADVAALEKEGKKVLAIYKAAEDADDRTQANQKMERVAQKDKELKP